MGILSECRKNLFRQRITSFTDKKDIMPTNGCAKPFVGIISFEKQDCGSVDFFEGKWIRTLPKKYLGTAPKIKHKRK